jgi:hypothetical protein
MHSISASRNRQLSVIVYEHAPNTTVVAPDFTHRTEQKIVLLNAHTNSSRGSLLPGGRLRVLVCRAAVGYPAYDSMRQPND